MSNLYWLTEEQMAHLRPYLPRATANRGWMTGGCSADGEDEHRCSEDDCILWLIFPNKDSIIRYMQIGGGAAQGSGAAKHRWKGCGGMAALAAPQIEEGTPLQITPRAA